MASGGSNRQTVLLVDDEPQVRALVREMLAHDGYTVLEAGDGYEALEICERHQDPIDLLLTDIVMPLMNGRELADRLTVMRPEMKALYMSGYMKEALLKYEGVSVTNIPFLQKPFTPQMLATKIRELMHGERAQAGGASSA